MKKFIALSSILLVAVMLLAGTGCALQDTSSKIGNNVNVNPSFIRYGTLQGKIMNAITGSAIGGDNLKVYLVQGKDSDEPDKLITDTTDNFVGEYAFENVAFGVVPGDLNFKIVVINEGYQRFEAIVNMTAGMVVGNNNLTQLDSDSSYTNEELRFIGDIYLYPLATSPGDITVTVRDPQGNAIPDATVLLRQNINNNNTTTTASGNVLAPAAGLYPSLSATSDTSGIATFSSDNLVLGGNYTATVEAMDFNGQNLATTSSAAFTAGTNSLTRVVNMTAINNALTATYASNQVANTVTASGSLTITFNQPVTVEKDKFTVEVNAGSDGVLSSVTATASLSSDKMTLTLSLPSWTTSPTTAGTTVTYTYTGKNIVLNNTNVDSGVGPFAVWNTSTAAFVSGAVKVITS